MSQLISWKYRLYPNREQRERMESILETHRRVYNHCLDARQAAWEYFRQTLRWTDLREDFSVRHRLARRRKKENPEALAPSDHYMLMLNNHSAHETIRRLDLAYDAFFKRMKTIKALRAQGSGVGARAGYPRFKGRQDFRTIAFVNGWKLHAWNPDTAGDFAEQMGAVYLQGPCASTRETMRVYLHREPRGRLKRCLLTRDGQEWYIVFVAELADCAVAPSEKPAVGIDVGLTWFLATSEGDYVANPRFLKHELPRLRRLERSKSRKVLRSGRRKKAAILVGKLHARIGQQRRDFHFQVASDLVKRDGLIAIEDLNIKGMLAHRRFARSISDVGWGSFFNVLSYVATKHGCTVVAVDPRGTTQDCSGCGLRVPKDLSVRRHCCPHCGTELCRDVNAARNILGRALARTEPSGLSTSPVGEVS